MKNPAVLEFAAQDGVGYLLQWNHATHNINTISRVYWN